MVIIGIKSLVKYTSMVTLYVNEYVIIIIISIIIIIPAAARELNQRNVAPA